MHSCQSLHALTHYCKNRATVENQSHSNGEHQFDIPSLAVSSSCLECNIQKDPCQANMTTGSNMRHQRQLTNKPKGSPHIFQIVLHPRHSTNKKHSYDVYDVMSVHDFFFTFYIFAAKLMGMMKEDYKSLTSQSWLVVINTYRKFENNTASHKETHFLQHNIHVYTTYSY
jgi:hypothetical protein